jgi:DNA invertase Pin-like site-specific DNA recombinase
MLIGYARTSTAEQQAGLEAQGRDLKAAGVEKLFSEQTSAVGPRKDLEAALDYLREDDVLVVAKLDRLARSVADLCAIVEKIERKGASLRILAMNLDTATPTGRLMVNVIGSVAQFEREIMLERQREGVAKAKAEGRYKGRKPTARAKSAEIIRLAGEGVKREDIAKRLGVGVASVYRMLAERKAAAKRAAHTVHLETLSRHT